MMTNENRFETRSSLTQFFTIAYIQLCTRLLLFRMFDLAISNPVNIGKPYHPLFEKSFKIGRIFAMHGGLKTSFSRSGLKKTHFYQNWSEALHGKNSSNFKTFFKQWVIGLSFEVYNSFLPQLA